MRDFEFAFVIEETFQTTLFGLIVISASNCPWRPQMKQTVLLKLQDGSEIRTQATAMLHPENPRRVADLSIKELTKDQVPIGTEVWVEKATLKS
jgi:hypothetical protein